jgi:hypothetical protein
VTDDLPAIGSRWRLRQHVGYQPDINPHHPYEAFVNRHHPIFAGQVGEVVEHIPAETDGAGTHDDDSIVLCFEHHELVIPPPTEHTLRHAQGIPTPLPAEHRVFHPTDPQRRPTEAVRRWSCTRAQLDELLDEVPAARADTEG